MPKRQQPKRNPKPIEEYPTEAPDPPWWQGSPTEDQARPEFNGVRGRLWRGLKASVGGAWNPHDAKDITQALLNLHELEHRDVIPCPLCGYRAED